MDETETLQATHHRPKAGRMRWAEGAVVYQIYPRSFQDSNGDGVGDLPGIISRLDYMAELGVTAIWISPFYPSPMADFGYDIADYRNVDPVFGTLDDFKKLLHEAAARNIKVVIDLVPNHTSDQHPWFQASRQSQDNEFADWYVWHDGRRGQDGQVLPPNNWLDVLNGLSAWEWNDDRQQYYLHSFHEHQPDLNWNNPAVREAIKEVMRFWLALGVDGFRVDAVYWLSKDPDFRDDPPIDPVFTHGKKNYSALKHENSMGWPDVYTYLSELAEVLTEPPFLAKQRFMVTEAYPEGHSSLDAYMAFYERVDAKVAAPFNFDGLILPWEPTAWRRSLKEFHAALNKCCPDGLASYAFGNHDQPRLASRLTPAAARSAAVMQLTLPGLIFIYYGEEIGMRNVVISPDRAQDPSTHNGAVEGGGRDPERTPMQWSAAKNAGFSDGDNTWLPLPGDYAECTVERQRHDAASLLQLYKRLIVLRASHTALQRGQITVVSSGHPDVLAFRRDFDNQSTLTVVNFSEKHVACLPDAVLTACLLSSDPRSILTDEPVMSTFELLPNEAAVFEVRPLPT